MDRGPTRLEGYFDRGSVQVEPAFAIETENFISIREDLLSAPCHLILTAFSRRATPDQFQLLWSEVGAPPPLCRQGTNAMETESNSPLRWVGGKSLRSPLPRQPLARLFPTSQEPKHYSPDWLPRNRLKGLSEHRTFWEPYIMLCRGSSFKHFFKIVPV